VVAQARGGLSATDDLVVPALGDSVLTVRAVMAMCALAARSHDEVADVVGSPEVVAEETASAGAPRLRVRVDVVGCYGADLCALAADVRRSVTRTLTDMTGLEVAGVDVTVTDVSVGVPGPVSEPAR
jgi:uncharacterized alkaline shock family protein YloU